MTQTNIYNIALEKIRKEIAKHDISGQSVELTLACITDIGKKAKEYYAACGEFDIAIKEVNGGFANLSYLKTIEREKQKKKDRAEFAITSL